MPVPVRLPDHIAAAVDATPEAAAHGRAYAASVLVARALGIEPPPTPNEAKSAARKRVAERAGSDVS